jgi:hypothetical protein
VATWYLWQAATQPPSDIRSGHEAKELSGMTAGRLVGRRRFTHVEEAGRIFSAGDFDRRKRLASK